MSTQSLVNDRPLTDAERDLVDRHYGLVGMFVSKTIRSHRALESDREDLFQEGALGLMRAVKTYTPVQGVFSTYAKFYILFLINTWLCNRHLIRPPRVKEHRWGQPMYQASASSASSVEPVTQNPYSSLDNKITADQCLNRLMNSTENGENFSSYLWWANAVEGLQATELAAETGYSRQSIQKRILKGAKYARQILGAA